MNKPVRSFLLRGKRWKLKWPRRIIVKGELCDGACVYEKGEIRVRPTLSSFETLETLLHEMLHAAHPDLDEKPVTETAHDIARVLWRLGYRMPQND